MMPGISTSSERERRFTPETDRVRDKVTNILACICQQLVESNFRNSPLMNFDEIRRIAETQLGKDTVDRIERQIAKQAGGPQEFLGASNIDFQGSEPGKKSDAPAPPVTPRKKSAKKAGKDAARVLSPTVQSSELKKLPAPAVTIPTSEPHAIAHQSTPPASASSSASERILAQAIAGEYRYAMLGLVLGMACIIGGVILCLNGVAGSTSWTAKLFGLFQSKINDAAPGVVLFVVGIFFVVATKPKVKLDKLRG